MFDCDILIVGAGPAGCAAAYDLARAGRRVLLLDKRAFPRPKACACGLTRKTLAALRYSVEPVIERTCHEIVLQDAPGISSNQLDEVRVRTRRPIAAMAVRERFDAFCLQQTLAAGASLHKIESILRIDDFRGGVAVAIATAAGIETLTAPVVIGADGSNGQTRRLTSSAVDGPSWYTKGFALEACIQYTALPAHLPRGDAPRDSRTKPTDSRTKPTDLVFDFAPLPGGYGWLFPKGDHINIGVGTFAPTDYDAELKIVTRQLLADYTQHKLGVSLTALNAQITGQHLGMGGDRYTPRGRVLLTGDAAGLVDPLTGEGIHSAIVSGQIAAAAILSNAASITGDIAAAYARRLLPLQRTLAFSTRAARAFYREPQRGLHAMRIPLLRSLILKTYADGVAYPRLIALLAKFV